MGANTVVAKSTTPDVFCSKPAMLSLTTDGPQKAYQPDGFYGDIHPILHPIHMIEFESPLSRQFNSKARQSDFFDMQ
jgi:hypothetical protein